jgi:hypothetical protein
MIVRADLSKLADRIFLDAAAAVQSGPFTGMTLTKEVSWGDGELLQKTLGIYEMELWPAIEDIIARRPELILNIGCAEGYYAIGLALRLPEAIVHAFDIDAAALRVCEATARANRAERNLRLERDARPEVLTKILGQSGSSALIVDCEGCEVALVDGLRGSDLVRTSVIVECHDFSNTGSSERIRAKLSETHRVEKIEQGARNPNAIPQLRKVHEDLRWLAMSEQRPETMCWIVATPKGE